MKSKAQLETPIDSESAPEIVSPRALCFGFLEYLFQYLRQTEIHDRSNRIFDRCMENFVRSMKALQRVPGFERVEVSFRGEQIYINQARMRPRVRQIRVNRFLQLFMRRRKLGLIGFPTDAPPEAIADFFWTISKIDAKDSNPVQTVIAELDKRKVEGFRIDSIKGLHKATEVQGGLADLELIGVILHEKIRKFVELCFDNLERTSQFPLQNLKEHIVDLMNLQEEDILQIFRINLMKRREREIPFVVTDCCFALVAWGKTLGLPPGVIQELAEASLSHGLGYVMRGKLNLDPLRDEARDQVFAAMTKLKSLMPLNELQRLAVFESFERYGENGVYELNGIRCYAHFFSRMIRIVAAYKYWTQARPNFDVMLPDEAMSEMLRSEADLDPSLLKLFVNWMGIYPVGTLLQLQTGEVVQVFAAGSDPTRFQRPIVSVLKDNEGKLLERPILMDLAEMNERLGVYRRSIKRSLSFEESGIPESHLKLTPLALS